MRPRITDTGRIRRSVAGAALAICGLAAAVAASDLDLGWTTIDSGGGTSAADGLVITGTIGQWEAGVSSVDGLVLTGGFWAPEGELASPPCPGDFDGSGAVDFGDLLEVLGAWGACPNACAPDLDGNGAIDFADLVALLTLWGPCPD